ncbi:MAG: hypothetical protein C5B44_00810 [Acidobacteria bacterium]|nr:MAG: hypothetical protein C5B44_00810 [Acidobacteriota bacterium]
MHPHIPMRELWWLAAGAGYGARYAAQRVRMAQNRARISRLPDPTDTLLCLQQKYGYNEHGLISIAPGVAAWTMPEIDGAIVYGEYGRVWLAAGDPLADPDDVKRLVKGFLMAATEARRIVCFVPATERFARVAVSLGLSAVKIGAAPYFDLNQWHPRGNAGKKIRAGVNQATRAGVTVELVRSPNDELRRETADLSLRWLRRRRSSTPFGWLFALDPFLRVELKRVFVARDSERRLVGLLAASPIPSRNGWYLEDVLRQHDAPHGTSDLLVVRALELLRLEGAELATLGTAPLAGDGEDEISTRDHPVIERALASASRRLTPFYNFPGIRRFKAKFAPTWWESEYALVQPGILVPTKVAPALLRAVAPGGLAQLLTRKAIHSLGY